MDHDFSIEIAAREGLGVLRQFLERMPFALKLIAADVDGELTLVQDAVSEFAGFHEAGRAHGDRHFFSASVRTSSQGDPEDVMAELSKVFKVAGLPHWIWRIEHEMDEDELVIDSGDGLAPQSVRRMIDNAGS